MAPRNYNTGALDFASLRSKFAAIATEVAMETQEYHRQMAVRALNVILRWTPPNGGGKLGLGALKTLKKRIASDIWNPSNPLTSKPQKLRRGGFGLGKKEGFLGAGGFPFVILKGRKPAGLQLTDPMTILKGHTRWKRVRGALRRVYDGPADRFFWVRSSALKKTVTTLQQHAGELVSGWYPAAKYLGVSKLGNYSPQGHSLGGSFRVQQGARTVGDMPAAAWSLDVTNRAQYSPVVSRWVAGNMARALTNRIALAQVGLLTTRLNAIGKNTKIAA